MTHPSRAERPERPVPSKDELLREGSRGHPPLLLRARGELLSPANRRRRSGHVWTSATTTSSSTSSRTNLRRARRAQTSRVRLPRRGGSNGDGGAKSLGPPRGSAPLLRLLGLVAIAVGVVLLFAVLINSCASSSRKDSYSSYMERRADDRDAVDGQRQARRDRADDAGHLGAADPAEAARHRRSRSSRTSTRRRTSTRPGGCAPRTATSSTRSPCASAGCSVSPTRSSRRRSAKSDDETRSTTTPPCSPARRAASSRATSSGTTSSARARSRSSRTTASTASPCPSRTSSRTTSS